ncbi:MAG: hypothetical protein AAB373_03825 [Patescibacteria group bacterium]
MPLKRAEVAQPNLIGEGEIELGVAPRDSLLYNNKAKVPDGCEVRASWANFEPVNPPPIPQAARSARTTPPPLPKHLLQPVETKEPARNISELPPIRSWNDRHYTAAIAISIAAATLGATALAISDEFKKPEQKNPSLPNRIILPPEPKKTSFEQHPSNTSEVKIKIAPILDSLK